MTNDGRLPSGRRYAVEVPRHWNGVVLLWSRPVPVPADAPAWPEGDALAGDLLGAGYAVAASANTIFWPLEAAFTDQPALLDVVDDVVPDHRHTIAFGMSIGGTISAGLVQRVPHRLSGALAMCANLAGAVAVHNTELDVGFVVKTLLAPDSALRLVGISEPFANLELALAVLEEAQRTPAGRARLALAAAVGNTPGWFEPGSEPPGADDAAARQANQYAWYRHVVFLVLFWAREQVERQAGGNPSWNTGVDYGELVATSVNRDEVEGLYEAAGLDVGDDLGRLAAAPRITADPAATAYLEHHIVFTGELGGVPVLTVHTDGDGLVTADNARAYAEVVAQAGQPDLLRQAWVHRAGHCTFTAAELLTALDVLVVRLDTGAWPPTDPTTLNASAAGHGPDRNRLPSGAPMAPGFFALLPPAFRRRYDGRNLA